MGIVAALERLRGRHEVYLDAPLPGRDGESGGATLLDILVGPAPATQDVAVEALERRELVSALLAGLPPRQAYILRERFWRERTLEEIASTLRLSRERVRQLQDEALVRLGETLKTTPALAAAWSAPRFPRPAGKSHGSGSGSADRGCQRRAWAVSTRGRRFTSHTTSEDR